MRSKSRSLLRYPGGKGRFAPLISEILRLNNIRPSVFAEPFCGGAGVSLALLEAGLVDQIAINDADPLVAALWLCVFGPEFQWLSDQVLSIPLTLDEWHRQRALTPVREREAALKCLYLNRTSFNGILIKSGPVGGKTQSRRTLAARFNRERLAARIIDLHRHADRVNVSNQDWQKFCRRIIRRSGAFLYLDPPYFHRAEKLYAHYFGETEHRRLRDALCRLDAPWLLSYDDAREVRGLYDARGLAVRVIDKPYSTHPRGGESTVGREVLYSNLPTLPTKDCAQPRFRGFTILSGEEAACRNPRESALRGSPDFSARQSDFPLPETRHAPCAPDPKRDCP